METTAIPEYLTISETVKALKVCRKTVLNWIGKGYFAAKKIGPGGRWRISVESIKEFLDKNFPTLPMPEMPLGGWHRNKNQVQLPIESNTKNDTPVTLDDKLSDSDSRIIQLYSERIPQVKMVEILTVERKLNSHHKVSWSQASVSGRIKSLRLRGLL